MLCGLAPEKEQLFILVQTFQTKLKERWAETRETDSAGVLCSELFDVRGPSEAGLHPKDPQYISRSLVPRKFLQCNF